MREERLPADWRKLLWVPTGVALVIGLVGLVDRLANGHEGAAYGSYVMWGLWVAMYLFFAGLATGCFFVASADYVFEIRAFRGFGRLCLVPSAAAMLAGLLHIWLDLGHLERIWRVYLQPNFISPMTQVVWLYTAFGLLLAVISWLAFKDVWRPLLGRPYTAEEAQADRRLIKALSILGLLVAFAVSSGVGGLLGIQASKTYWHVGLFPVQFVFFALASGVALMLIVAAFFYRPAEDRGRRQRILVILAQATLALALLKAFFLFADYVQSIYGGEPANVEAIRTVVLGPYPLAFWGLQIFLGIVVPVVILLHPRLSKDGPWLGVAGLLTLIGFVAARLIIVIPAQVVPELEGLRTAFVDERLTFEYFPSLWEWAVTVGIGGLAVALFLLAYQFLLLAPVREEVPPAPAAGTVPKAPVPAER